jgi:hypothetical protein
LSSYTDRARAVELLVAAQIGDAARLRALLPLCGDPVEDGVAAKSGGRC